jgi:hypothetical protein
MAEDYKRTGSIQGGRVVSGYKGSKAGQGGFRTAEQVAEDNDWDQYKIERKLMFTAQRKQHEADFREWRKKKAAKKGQTKAVSQ